MPFCPVCGYEYEKNIEECPDCEVALVDKLEPEHFDGEMVDVYHSFSVAEAGMVKELLYNEGIFSAISNEIGSTIFGGLPGDTGEVRVFVADSDEERAREMIEEYMEDNPLDERDDIIVCPKCGASVDEGEEVCPFCGANLE